MEIKSTSHSIDRSQPPVEPGLVKPEIPNLEEAQTASGIPIYLFRPCASPIASVSLWVSGGRVSQEQPLQAKMAAAAIMDGTSKHSANDIAEKVAWLGGNLSGSAGNSVISITTSGLTRNLPELTEILESCWKDAVLPDKEFTIRKQSTLQSLTVSMEQSNWWAQGKFNELLWGKEHARGRITFPEEVKALENDVVRKFYNQQINLRPHALVLAGDISDAVYHKAEKLVKGLAQVPRIEGEAPKPVSGQLVKIPVKNAKQCSLVMGAWLMDSPHIDRRTAWLANLFLGGYFGSRLMQNIREKKGLTYGINSGFSEIEGHNLLKITAQVNSENAIMAYDEIRKEIEILASEPVSENEWLNLKNYLYGTVTANLLTPFAREQSFGNLYFTRMGYKQLAHNLNAFDELTPADVQRVVQEWFRFDRFSCVIAGNISA